jgi:hypothetical protein
LERQHIIFIIAAGAAFAALIGLAYFNPFQQTEGDENESPDVLKVKKGSQVNVRYSSSVVRMIQDLPNKNALEIEVSSELQVTNLAGLRGEVRYSDMEITYVQDGEVETINEDDFKTIEYRFFPDRGNTTKYLYENVDYIAKATDSQLVVTVKPLSSAKVGERYTVGLIMHTGSIVGYSINDKVIEIVP